MSFQLHSSEDFDVSTSDVNLHSDLTPARDSHVSGTFQLEVDQLNTFFSSVHINVADNVRTISGALPENILLTDYETLGNANTRTLQSLYFKAIACALYGAGTTDTRNAAQIGSAQILTTSSPVNDSSQVNSTLWSNAFELATEASSKFSLALDAHRSGEWLTDLLEDMHTNTLSGRSMLSPVDSDEPNDTFKPNFQVNDALFLYFTMITRTDDGSLGTTRQDDQGTGDDGFRFNNPPLNKIRIGLNILARSSLDNEVVSQVIAAGLLEDQLSVQASVKMAALEAHTAVVLLTNQSFANGTVVISPDFYIHTNSVGASEKVTGSTAGKVFRLSEDVVFNPNPVNAIAADPANPTGAEIAAGGFPLGSQTVGGGGLYDDAAFGLGFFAALVVSGSNLVVDLGGFTIKQAEEHALQQRFFAVVELADSPFIANQGPFSFTTGLSAANNVLVKNGTIGRSSHHGIHGNLGVDVLLKDLVISDYETAAVALNGVTGGYFENITATGTSTNIPTLASWSQVKFLHKFIKHLQASSAVTLNSLSANDVITNLENAMKGTYEELIDGATGQLLAPAAATTNALFRNESRKADGSAAYGILVNKKGIAVDGLPTERTDSSKNVYMKNVAINSTDIDVNGIAAIEREDTNGVETDPIGAVLITQNGSTVDNEGRYTGNVLSDAQLWTAKSIIGGADVYHSSTARNSISQRTLDWAENNETLGEAQIHYKFNRDSMNHILKGAIGLFVGGSENVVCRDVTVDGVANSTKRYALQEEDLDGWSVPAARQANYDAYVNATAPTANASLSGSAIADSRGFLVSAGKDVFFHDCSSLNINSKLGFTRGYDTILNSEEVTFKLCHAEDLNAGTDLLGTLQELQDRIPPMKKPDSVGYSIDDTSSLVQFDSVTVENLTSVIGDTINFST